LQFTLKQKRQRGGRWRRACRAARILLLYPASCILLLDKPWHPASLVEFIKEGLGFRTVAELFPEIVTPLLDRADHLPACSAVEALERQEPFINQTLAYQALAMLARLFRHGELTYYGGFVSLADGRVAPLTIPTARSPRSLKRAA
jgi:hypothetical protein